ncbi:MAG: hypothetical protein AB1941_10445 [Gemmatimonadota bacterium]
MRPLALALPLLLLAALPARAQAPADPAKELRITSASPGRDAYFRVRVDAGSAPAGSTLWVTAASAMQKQGDDVQVRTPATLRIVSEAPFRVTLASAAGEGPIQLLRSAGGREVVVSGDEISLEREERGGPVTLLRAREIHVRVPEKPVSRE